MKLDKEILLSLKEKLPHGAIKEIATKLGYSYEYTCAVFSGNVSVNEQMINEAQLIIRREAERKNDLETQLRNI